MRCETDADQPPTSRSNALTLLTKSGSSNPLGGWTEIVESIDKVGLHFHYLRHTGNTPAAQPGASTRDLMARMGHVSMNAAIIYQQATRRADRATANALGVRLRAGREGDDDPDGEAADGLVPA